MNIVKREKDLSKKDPSFRSGKEGKRSSNIITIFAKILCIGPWFEWKTDPMLST